MNEKINNFKNWLIANGYAKNTYINDVVHLKVILLFIDNQEITEETINKFFISINNKTDNTVNSYIKSLKKYLQYINLNIRLPKMRKVYMKKRKLCSFIDFEENIIEMIDEDISRNVLKDKAVLYLMLYTGARRSEIYKLERGDFDLINKQVILTQTKTKKDRVAFYPEKVKNIIEAYFISEPEYDNAFNIKETYIYSTLFKKLKPFYSEFNLTPHTTRHIFSTEYLKATNNDLKGLQEIRGDENIATTARYVHLSDEELQNNYNEAIENIEKKRKKN